jgi:hypothetical protein
MHPALRPYYDHVIPVFWPWLWLNLVRVALWHLRTGHEALLAVDCFGNIRMVFTADEPKPDNLYTYEAPLVPRWENPVLGSDLPVSAPAFGYSAFIASLCRVYAVFYVVRERVRGPPVQHPPPSFDFAQDEFRWMSSVLYRTPKALMLSEVEARARAPEISQTHRTAPAAPAFRAAPSLKSPTTSP